MEGLKKSFLVRGNNIVGFSDKNFSTAPIGTVLSFAGQTAPNGYLLCDGASYKVADYPDLYAVIGNTYGGDTENFNVPNLVDKFIQGSTTSGEEKEAGLPNITGTFYHDTNATSSLSGAFFSYTRGSSQNLKNDDTVKSSGYISFDASKSNSIYGKSTTVQPPALTMVYIIKAFHTNEGVDSGVSDDVVEYVDTKISSNLGEKVDYKVVVEDGTRYVEDIVVQDINTWLPNDNSSIVINLKKANGANYSNFQLLCNKKDSKNWSCIVNGAAHELWKIRYVNEVRYIDEIATMDKVVPQVIIENKTTDDARTIIQNSWGAFPTNNSLAKIETSIFTWSAQIYKLDSSWGTIILTCYADDKDSYIGKLSNKAWHWYKMGLTEV